MEFFVLKDGERLGPFTRKELKEKIADGTVGMRDRAWNIGRPDWKPVTRAMATSGSPKPLDSRFWVLAVLIVLLPAALFYVASLRRPPLPARMDADRDVVPAEGATPVPSDGSAAPPVVFEPAAVPVIPEEPVAADVETEETAATHPAPKEEEVPAAETKVEPEATAAPTDTADYSLRLDIETSLKTIETSSSSTKRDYLRSLVSGIRVTNFGHAPVEVEVEWLFFSRPASGIGRAVFDRGAQSVKVNGGGWETLNVTSAPVREGFDTIKGKRRDTGRKIEGCIVRAKVGDRVLLAKGSSEALDGIASDPSLLEYFLEPSATPAESAPTE